MKIRWKIVDQILKLTNSTPKQLLDWLSDKHTTEYETPCSIGRTYLNHFWFFMADNDAKVVELWDQDELFVPHIAKDIDIINFWYIWREDEKQRTEITAKFKKRYRL